MFKKLLAISFVFIVMSGSFAQNANFPDLAFADLNGNRINVKQMSIESKPVVLSFWATWCGPCMLELNAINDKMNDWLDEADFQFYAVSIDDSKTVGRVVPMVNGKGWDFEVLLDTNNELKRQLNFSTPPFTVIVKDGAIVYRHIGYQPGVEDQLFEKIKELTNQ